MCVCVFVGCVRVCVCFPACATESETAEGFLKLAWRQADVCKYVPGCL